jgi:hypothetical protein
MWNAAGKARLGHLFDKPPGGGDDRAEGVERSARVTLDLERVVGVGDPQD